MNLIQNERLETVDPGRLEEPVPTAAYLLGRIARRAEVEVGTPARSSGRESVGDAGDRIEKPASDNPDAVNLFEDP
jgi:hypothetical protein